MASSVKPSASGKEPGNGLSPPLAALARPEKNAGASSASVPPAVELPHGASADLRTVQASLDRFQGSRDKKKNDGDGPSHTYNAERVLGSGAFGIVYQARIIETGEMVAIKKVLQDARFKNRELEIMQELSHPNIVELKSFFHVPGDKPKENYLNVVMEYCPETMQCLMTHYTKSRQTFPYTSVQLYTYHMLRGVAYMNAKNICHRDIKPPNLLVNKETHELKLCDFGSAKRLAKGEPNVAYICSRYYRAPELIFGATEYSPLIDMWSLACVTAEMILQQVLFPGDSGVDQLMEIIKVLGTPTRDQLEAMNPVYGEFKFPQIKSYPWKKIFKTRTTPEAVDWLSKVLQYDPKKRPNGLQACTHSFFDALRNPANTMKFPLAVFWFSDEELALTDEAMMKALVPDWVNKMSPNLEQGGKWPQDLGRVIRPDPDDLPASSSSCLFGEMRGTLPSLYEGEEEEATGAAKTKSGKNKKSRPRTKEGESAAGEGEGADGEDKPRKSLTAAEKQASSRRRKRDKGDKQKDSVSPMPEPTDEALSLQKDAAASSARKASDEADPLDDLCDSMQNRKSASNLSTAPSLDARLPKQTQKGSGPLATPRQPLQSAGAALLQR